MASSLDIAISTYQHYERDEREAPASLIPKIAAFGFSYEWLLTGREPSRATGEASGTEPGASADIDIDILTGVIEALENYLNAGRLMLDPAPKARLVAVLYDHFADTGETANKKTIARFIRLVA